MCACMCVLKYISLILRWLEYNREKKGSARVLPLLPLRPPPSPRSRSSPHSRAPARPTRPPGAGAADGGGQGALARRKQPRVRTPAPPCCGQHDRRRAAFSRLVFPPLRCCPAASGPKVQVVMGFGAFEDTAVVGRRSFGEFNRPLEVCGERAHGRLSLLAPAALALRARADTRLCLAADAGSGWLPTRSAGLSGCGSI